MTTHPFYFTWSQQKTPCAIPIDRCDDYNFYREDQSYLDLSSLSYQASFGLHNDIIKEAIHHQLDHLAMASPKHVFELKTQVSEELLGTLGLKGKLFYTVSGAESIENALKLARQIRGATKVLARRESYHGASLGALSITGDWRHDHHATVDQWTIRMPDYRTDPEASDLQALIEREGPDTIAAICLETIIGGNGVYRAPASWYEKVQHLCHQHGIFLILDEVICGFGRTGPYFGFHHYPFLKPDFVCLSKAITGGYIPFGALYTSEHIARYYDDNVLSAGLTNYAHPLGLAALQGVQHLLNQDYFWRHQRDVIALLEEFARKIADHVRAVRQAGALMAIELRDDQTITMTQVLTAGLYCIVQQDLKRLVLAPALTIPSSVLQEGLGRLERMIYAQ